MKHGEHEEKKNKRELIASYGSSEWQFLFAGKYDDYTYLFSRRRQRWT
jgi:hypothetical protein